LNCNRHALFSLHSYSWNNSKRIKNKTFSLFLYQVSFLSTRMKHLNKFSTASNRFIFVFCLREETNKWEKIFFLEMILTIRRHHYAAAVCIDSTPCRLSLNYVQREKMDSTFHWLCTADGRSFLAVRLSH
jgi:hypothetical protein